MCYQLILQSRAESLEDYDSMAVLEDKLISELGVTTRVDGHDMGSGEANIFILTSDPRQTFRQAMPALERSGRLQRVKAAFREVGSDLLIVIWPDGCHESFTVA